MSHVISLSCITIWDFSEGLGIDPADGRAAGAGAGTCSLKHGEMSSAAGWATAGGLHTKNYLLQAFASASASSFKHLKPKCFCWKGLGVFWSGLELSTCGGSVWVEVFCHYIEMSFLLVPSPLGLPLLQA